MSANVTVHLNNLELIENAGPNTLKAYLADAIPRAYGADLAIAFITENGLYQILHLLKRTAERRPVRILTGLFQFVTEPAALVALLDVQQETNGRISARLTQQTF
jgi:HKD family nuclease